MGIDCSAVPFDNFLTDFKYQARTFDLRGKQRVEDLTYVLIAYAFPRVHEINLHLLDYIPDRYD